MNEIQESVIKSMNKIETGLLKSLSTKVEYTDELKSGTILSDKFLCLIEIDPDFEFADVQLYDITNGLENAMGITSFSMDNPGNKMSLLDVFENVMDEYSDGLEGMEINLYSYEDGKSLFEEDTSGTKTHTFSSSSLLGVPDCVLRIQKEIEEDEDEDEV